jgi:two-component system, NtrC family, nitrogen regulation sensor histidine kinase NtrY
LLAFFLALSVAAQFYAGKSAEPDRITKRIGERIAEELRYINSEAEGVIGNFKRNPSGEFDNDLHYPFFLIEGGRITRWNDYHFVPSTAALQEDFSVKLLKEGNSEFLALKWNLDEDRFLAGLIPLTRRYPISNIYLQPQINPDVFSGGEMVVLSPDATHGVPVCVDGNCLFRVAFNTSEVGTHGTAKVLAAVFIAGSILLFLLLFFELFRHNFAPDLVFLFLLLMLSLVRLLMTALDFPARFIPGELFDPHVFASSNFNASLGDLLLNEIALFFLTLYLFKNIFHFRSVHFLRQTVAGRWLLGTVSTVLVLFAMLFPFVVIQTLYNNSAIVLGISDSLQFDGLRIAASLSVVISGLCTFLFSHVFIRLIVGDGNRARIFFSVLAGVLFFVGVNEFSGQAYVSSLVVGVLYFLAFYLLRLKGSLRRLSFKTFTYLFISIVFISFNSAYAMHVLSREEKIDHQFRFARNYLVDRDYFAEYLLSDLSSRISRDYFIQSRIATPFLGKDAVKQKIRQVFLPTYFNKYDIEIYTFNAAGESSDGHAGASLPGLLSLYDHDASRTEYQGVYFIEGHGVEHSQKYVVVVPVNWMRSIAGTIVVELSLKKVIPENVYPELLVDNRFLDFYRSQEISYGVYAQGKLAYSSGSFNYEGLFDPSWFGDPALHTEGVTKQGYYHIAHEDDYGRVAVVSSRATPVPYSIANFSYLLVIGLGTILVFVFIQSIVVFWTGGKLYFAARIQLFLNLAFFLPLIIVSIMSLRVTNTSSGNQINEEYISKAKRFSETISDELHRNLVSSYEPAGTFSNQLKDLAVLSNLDANVYYISGVLFATSQPQIFENRLLSEYMNPSPFIRIRRGDNLFIETERVGSLEYSTVYAALKAPTSGAIIGIVGIPFFQSVYSSEKVQMNILANILNIFAMIFIVLVALSYVVTQWLTFPLMFITQSLRRTSLTKANQPLVWKADDEIGLMVKEYNKMLYSLSESKAELEQTQRERAWREIAQQVAHEIKNPLTPMKLTLQQLERSVENGNAGPEKVQKAISSLLIQVNTLNDIASSFSSFAKMPEPVMKPFELMSLLKRVVDLHSHSGTLKLDSAARELFVMGDEQLVARTFSNIILNAIQAVPPGELPLVHVRVVVSDRTVLISFTDNGKGIEPRVAERMFIPHFTTKKSGSGLGLAIAKQAIEQMEGRLWFETDPGTGSVFFIELPLADAIVG